VLSTESEKVELRRCLSGLELSAEFDARPNGLFRFGERLCVAVLFAIDFGPPFGGLNVRFAAIVLERVCWKNAVSCQVLTRVESGL